jgi:hypothetical protein
LKFKKEHVNCQLSSSIATALLVVQVPIVQISQCTRNLDIGWGQTLVSSV